jgi:integrase
MAENIKRLPSGSYRVQLRMGGKRIGRTFTTQAAARHWRDAQRTQQTARRNGELPGERKTLADALRRYADEVAPTHRGAHWERVRLAAFERHEHLPLATPIARVTTQQLARWVEWRGTRVGPGSVRRELSLMGSVFAAARKDWHWIKSNPLTDVRQPPAPPHSDRVLTRPEIRVMLRTLGYRWGKRPASMQQMVAYAMLLALRTGMRAGEIVGLTWVNVSPFYVTLPLTKNGSARDVPLSAKAQRLVTCLRGLDEDRVLPITGQSLDALFRKAREKAGLDGFVFHTTRHTAATWIGATVGQPGRLSFPWFCGMFGWRDPRNAMIYVNPSAEDLARKL